MRKTAIRLKDWGRAAFRRVGLDVRRIPPGGHGAADEMADLRWLANLGIRTVVDIGANVGQFSLFIHRLLPDATIYAFEPLADCFEELRFRMRNVERFRAFNVTLGDRDGEVAFNRSEFSQSSSCLPMADLHKQAFAFSAGARLETVKIARLDDVAAGLALAPPLLVKIDVQGFEDRVIAGGRDVVRRAKVALIEVSFRTLYEGQFLFADVLAQLAPMGFSYHGSLAQLRSPIDGEILQADAIFVNEKA